MLILSLRPHKLNTQQINYKGLREPISGEELINITQEGIKNYKQYNRREREWSASRGYP